MPVKHRSARLVLAALLAAGITGLNKEGAFMRDEARATRPRFVLAAASAAVMRIDIPFLRIMSCESADCQSLTRRSLSSVQ